MEDINSEQQRLCFLKEGENGMQVQIVGEAGTLMTMVQSAILSHVELRKLFMPVMMNLMKSEEFMAVCMQDMLSSMGGMKDDEDEILDTE